MSDNLTDLAAQFRERSAAKTGANTMPASPAQRGSGDQELDDVIDLRIGHANEQHQPNEPKLLKTPPKRTPKTTSGKTTGVFTINMPPQLEQATQAAAEQNDLWHIEYIRAAIDAYGHKIQPRPKGPRRRSRTANADPSRTYKLGSLAKRQLEQAAQRTNRSQTDAFKRILQQAIDQSYRPDLGEID